VWLDQNRNGILDEHEVGVKDVLVELRVPGKRAVEHVIKTGHEGEYQFTLDALDFVADAVDGVEFYIQVYPPDGYKFSLPKALDEKGCTDDHFFIIDDESGGSPPFYVVLGEKYTVDTGLVTACDPSLGVLSFSGIDSVTPAEPGCIHLKWEPAILLSQDQNHPLGCDEDDIKYDVYVAQAPVDFELLELSDPPSDILHIETDELEAAVDDLEPGEAYSVLVLANAGGIVSEERDQHDVIVNGRVPRSEEQIKVSHVVQHKSELGITTETILCCTVQLASFQHQLDSAGARDHRGNSTTIDQ